MFHRLVWMIQEQTTAELISFGAHSSRVKYFYEGMEYDEIVMNEDFIPYEELGFDYEVVGGEDS